MPSETRIVSPGPIDRTVTTSAGAVLTAPDDWELLPPGDAGLTRRVKAGGPTWTVKEQKGRRTFSRGVWAPAARIAAVKSELEAERSTESYAKRRKASAARRDKKQTEYVDEFQEAVIQFLRFEAKHAELAQQIGQGGDGACDSCWQRHGRQKPNAFRLNAAPSRPSLLGCATKPPAMTT